MAAVLCLIPVVWQLAFSERDGSSTCERYPLPEGTIISESAELAVTGEVTLLPPQLICSYPVGDPASPTHVIVSHDHGAVWITASACLFIVAAAARLREGRRLADRRNDASARESA
ncbi:MULTISPECIES: hypothetical protein [unclassified Diaminobutyricimonas]|uniref:hypothetical protein n=1 Tax=unclassified Diaminobutyricimonas TaxID=2643261 RepID=UPI0012F4E31E|nr:MULTISPECIES: hypothetical protein [unclassified Diaminobutyricimonas]